MRDKWDLLLGTISIKISRSTALDRSPLHAASTRISSTKGWHDPIVSDLPGYQKNEEMKVWVVEVAGGALIEV
jgi:hypothetical protein